MTRNEIIEKVRTGSKFYVNFEKRSVRVDGKLVVENGDFGEDKYEKEGDFSLEGTLATIEDLYYEYLHSVPSERSESHRRTYFIALKEKDLDDDDIMYGELREVSRARLETYVLEAISRGWLYWDEEKMGSYFWQSKKYKSLIILRDWVEGPYAVRDSHGNVLRKGRKVRFLDEENKDQVFTVYGVSKEVMLYSDEYGDIEALPDELVLA